jgi:hypothetical protein
VVRNIVTSPQNSAAVPRPQLRRQPGLVEEGELQVAAPVGDDDLGERLVAAVLVDVLQPDLGLRVQRPHADALDPAADGGLVADLEFVERRQLALLQITPGVVAQQVADGLDPEHVGERGGRPRPDEVAQLAVGVVHGVAAHPHSTPISNGYRS